MKKRYGDSIITPAIMLGTAKNVPDRIAFGLPAILGEDL